MACPAVILLGACLISEGIRYEIRPKQKDEAGSQRSANDTKPFPKFKFGQVANPWPTEQRISLPSYTPEPRQPYSWQTPIAQPMYVQNYTPMYVQSDPHYLYFNGGPGQAILLPNDSYDQVHPGGMTGIWHPQLMSADAAYKASYAQPLRLAQQAPYAPLGIIEGSMSSNGRSCLVQIVKDPKRGNRWYTMSMFKQKYVGNDWKAEWDRAKKIMNDRSEQLLAAEMRIDPRDGNWYTREAFEEYYGGWATSAWDLARDGYLLRLP